MGKTKHVSAPATARPDPDRFKHLPADVRLEDTITTKDDGPVPDPEGGRDTDRDFMLRYAG